MVEARSFRMEILSISPEHRLILEEERERNNAIANTEEEGDVVDIENSPAASLWNRLSQYYNESNIIVEGEEGNNTTFQENNEENTETLINNDDDIENGITIVGNSARFEI